MNASKSTSKIFNLRQATQMLPLVQSITSDIVDLAKEVAQTRQRLQELSRVRITLRDAEEIYSDEVHSIETLVKSQTERIQDYQSELVDLGLSTDRVLDGFVDFPAVRFNETILLCWKLGEPEVRYWRHLDQSCEQRQLVDLEIIRQSGDHAFI